MALRLSISARIFGGFLVVLIAFSGVMGYTFFRMHRLRQELMLVNESYLKLTLIMAELYAYQSNLLKILEEVRHQSRSTSRFLRSQVRFSRPYRQRELRRALRIVDSGHRLVSSERDRKILQDIKARLEDLTRGFSENELLFTRLFSGGLGKQQQVEQMGELLLRLERKLAKQIRLLRDRLHGHLNATASRVMEEETRAVWFLLAMVVVAVLVSIAVTFGARRTLRPLKGLVAGTKRIGSGDYSQRVVIDTRDELGMLAREFNNMAAAVEEREQRLIRSERMAAAGRIASHITHEIRNPLSSISLNTELLEEEFQGLKGAEADEAQSLCKAIQQEVDRLTDLTEEYLRFSRLPRPELQREDLHELLTSLLSFMSTELSEKGVRLVQDIPEGLPAVEADENQLRQAFVNLLRNAGEAMSPDGGTLEITARSRGGQVELIFADSGPGIQPGNLAKIFEPFFSTKKTGSGLGLALTQQIIHEHGGTIEVQSSEGEGTRFTVRLGGNST